MGNKGSRISRRTSSIKSKAVSKGGDAAAAAEGNGSGSRSEGRQNGEKGAVPDQKDSMNVVNPVAIHTGEGTTRAGFPPHDIPRATFPTMVGRPKQPTVGGKDYYVGDEAESKRRVLNLSRPIQRGAVQNWNDLEIIWQHTFDSELRCDPRDHPVILTEPPLMDRADRERVAQIMLETFEVPGLCLVAEQVVALHHAGHATGVVLDSGEGVTYAVPIYEGRVVQHAVVRADHAGRDMTELLEKLLAEKELYVPRNAQERERVRMIKENAGCYVAMDFDEEMKKTVRVTYELDDGRTIDIGDASFRAPESLFQPNLFGINAPGIHNMVFEAIMKCDIDIRKELAGCIVLAGGNTLFKGLPERLEKELVNLAPSGVKVLVYAGGERRFSTWLGASVIASLPEFKDRLISRAEWDEEGSCVVHRKCW